jgi:hypothetical protein
MGDPLSGLIVLAIGGSVAPPLLLLTILYLGSQCNGGYGDRYAFAEIPIRDGRETVQNAPQARLQSQAQVESLGHERIRKRSGRRQVRYR